VLRIDVHDSPTSPLLRVRGEYPNEEDGAIALTLSATDVYHQVLALSAWLDQLRGLGWSPPGELPRGALHAVGTMLFPPGHPVAEGDHVVSGLALVAYRCRACLQPFTEQASEEPCPADELGQHFMEIAQPPPLLPPMDPLPGPEGSDDSHPRA
jgi:hypothetical protein